MPTDEEELTDVPAGAAPEEQCMPCRGTGLVISRLGGTPRQVACPWCRGSGIRLSGIDAQSGWQADSEDGDSGSGDDNDAA